MIYNLGKNGYLFEIGDSCANEQILSKDRKIILIVDVSGSMGVYAKRIITDIWEKVLKAIGYNDNSVASVITFARYSKKYNIPIGKFDEIIENDNGDTQISGVFHHLDDEFVSTSSNIPIDIVVISDGEISDSTSTIISAKKLAAKKIHNCINVTAIRLITSKSSNPDTTALSCLGMLGEMTLIDEEVDNRCYSNVAGEKIVNILVSKLMTRCNYGTICSDSPVLRTKPTDKLCCAIQLNKTGVLIAPETDLSCVFFNGVSLETFLPLKEISFLSDIKFLTDMISSLKVKFVVGNKDAQFIEMIEWFEQLFQLIESTDAVNIANIANIANTSNTSNTNNFPNIANIANTSNTNNFPNARLGNRLFMINNRVKKELTGLKNLFQQFKNQSRLDVLNSNQIIADWLREDVKSVGTAKRIQKNSEKTHDEIVSDTIKYAVELTNDTDIWSEDKNEISYLSQATNSEYVGVVRDMENSDLPDLLQMMGLIGICFESDKKDLPNPWNFYPSKVFMGNYYLSEADTCTINEIKYPGTDDIVTGVVPLIGLNSKLYREYNFGKFKEISELHAGISIRGVLGSIPYDILAMNTGVLRWILSDIGSRSKPISTIEHSIISQLIEQITLHISMYATQSFKPIAEALCSADPTPFLIGMNDAAYVSKLVAILFAHPDCEEVRTNKNKLQNVLAILYDLAVYTEAKNKYGNILDPELRTRHLIELLGIDMEEFEKITCVGKPFEPDPEFVSISINLDESIGRIPQWCPNFDEYKIIYKLLQGKNTTRGANGIVNGNDSEGTNDVEDVSNSEVFGVDENYDNDANKIKLWAVVHGIYAKNESYRIDKNLNVSKFPLPNSPMTNNSIQSIVNIILKQDFDKRLCEKRKEERVLKVNKLINELAMSESETEFIDLLKGDGSDSGVSITNRSTPDYDKLVKELTKIDEKSVVSLRFEKICILITGHDSTNSIKWANGNVLRDNLAVFFNVYEKLGKHHDLELLKTRMKEMKNKHVYRKSGCPNRHGHNIDKPSYWALGFKTLSSFENACKYGKDGYKIEDWINYLKKHYACCGT